jgi:hypothetical protein
MSRRHSAALRRLAQRQFLCLPSIPDPTSQRPLPEARPCSQARRALARPGRVPLGSTLSYPGIAAIISEVTGWAIRLVGLTPGQLTARWTAAGLPENLARAAADLDVAISRGDYDRTTATVKDLTGRPPRSFRDFAREELTKPRAWNATPPAGQAD